VARNGSGVTEHRGALRVAFTVNGETVRRTLSAGGKPMRATPANRRHAERLVAEIRAKIKLGVFSMHEYFPADPSASTGRGHTVAAQLADWLAAQRIEASTRAGYSSAIRFWSSTIGDKVLLALKHSDILHALATRPALTGKTINNYVSVLREALAMAVLDRTIAVNPVSDIPRAKHQKAPTDPFSRDEAEAIIAHMLARYPEPVANMAEAKFFTGLRSSEAAGLRWPNVDTSRAEIVVSEAIVRGKTKLNTKTNVARVVELNSRALAAIKRQKAHTFLAGEHVFLDPRYGTPWLEERAFRRSYWEPTLRALGMRYRPPYNTRHTFATMMLMSGMDPAYCARQLGHSVEIFHSTYAKWIDGNHNAGQRARLEAFLATPAEARATR
jgi:integrase